MNELATAPPHEIELFEPPPNAVYTIEATAQIVDVPRRTVIRYYQRGMVSTAVDPRRGFYFNRDAIRQLRRIENLRPICRDSLASIKIILALTDEVERLKAQSFSRKHGANGNAQDEIQPQRRKNDHKR
jgi:DNA-binding transcriptional MerR regulator